MRSGLTVVVGLGKTGLSCVRYLASRREKVAVIDTRMIPPCVQEVRSEFPHVSIYLDGFYEDILNQAEEIVVSPGVCIRESAIVKQAVRNVKPVGDIELFLHAAQAPIIAITGSNGKSTVTTLIGEMAKASGKHVAVGGNLGQPVLELLNENVDLYVVELSSFQLETTYSLRAAVATVLNISPDHLDRYSAYQDYVTAKLKIYHGCQAAVINRDDSCAFPSAFQSLIPTFFSFGLSDPKTNEFGLRVVGNELFLAFGKNLLLETKQLKLKGKHQYLNALAALAIGHCINLPMHEMLNTLRIFEGLPHRCQWVAEKNGTAWYNDSKATNVGATLAALQGLGPEIAGKIILLAGGLGKNADFSSLRDSVGKYVRQLILFGQDKQQLKRVLQDVVTIKEVVDLPEAIDAANTVARTGDIVLLSPACASFDMFSDFEHRGNAFCELVRAIC